MHPLILFQVHYRKVHHYNDDAMPAIHREKSLDEYCNESIGPSPPGKRSNPNHASLRHKLPSPRRGAAKRIKNVSEGSSNSTSSSSLEALDNGSGSGVGGNPISPVFSASAVSTFSDNDRTEFSSYTNLNNYTNHIESPHSTKREPSNIVSSASQNKFHGKRGGEGRDCVNVKMEIHEQTTRNHFSPMDVSTDINVAHNITTASFVPHCQMINNDQIQAGRSIFESNTANK